MYICVDSVGDKMKHLLVVYYKEYNAYHLFWNNGKHAVIPNSKAHNLHLILSNYNPNWRATIQWVNITHNDIDMMYILERK